MENIFALAFAGMVAVAMLTPMAAGAAPRGRSTDSGVCPAGTAADNCGARARYVSHCTVANFKKCGGRKSGK
jgi:hypothetical protein